MRHWRAAALPFHVPAMGAAPADVRPDPGRRSEYRFPVTMSNVHGSLNVMRTIAAGEFKQRCLRLLDEVGASGEPIVITKRGRAVAQLAPVASGRHEDWRGAMSGQGEITGDLVAPATGPNDWDALRG